MDRLSVSTAVVAASDQLGGDPGAQHPLIPVSILKAIVFLFFQKNVACQAWLPVIVYTREAEDDNIELLKGEAWTRGRVAESGIA